MATLAKNQVTVVDLSDAKQVQVYLSATQGWGQTHNPDAKSYTPNFVTKNNVITPQVFQTGASNNQLAQCSGIVWTVGGAAVTSSTSGLKVNADHTLTISKNFTSPTTVKFEATFTDSTTKATIKVASEKTINYVEGVGALFQVRAIPTKDTFSQSDKADITVVATCYRGGTVDSDGVTYKWEALKGGSWQAVTSGRASAGTLTVKADDVDSFQTFRVTATDSGTGATGGAATASDLVTIRDMTDPYRIDWDMPQGDKIKNGTGSITIGAQVWQGTDKIEDASTAVASRIFTYTWTKYNAAGTVTNWNGTTSPTKTGNPITVSAADVSQKTTIVCEISK